MFCLFNFQLGVLKCGLPKTESQPIYCYPVSNIHISDYFLNIIMDSRVIVVYVFCLFLCFENSFFVNAYKVSCG
jgi:hypothetical protein